MHVLLLCFVCYFIVDSMVSTSTESSSVSRSSLSSSSILVISLTTVLHSTPTTTPTITPTPTIPSTTIKSTDTCELLILFQVSIFIIIIAVNFGGVKFLRFLLKVAGTPIFNDFQRIVSF